MLKAVLLLAIAVSVHGDGYDIRRPSNGLPNIYVSTSGHVPVFQPTDFNARPSLDGSFQNGFGTVQTFQHSFQSNDDKYSQQSGGSQNFQQSGGSQNFQPGGGSQNFQQVGSIEHGARPSKPHTSDFSATRNEPPTVRKFYYVFGAPKDSEEEVTPESVSGSYQPEEHHKVIFIKVPDQKGGHSRKSSLNIGKRVEEKTKVYVLLKDQDQDNVEDNIDINLPDVKPSKPEVVFIKYKNNKKVNNVDGVSGIRVIGSSNVNEDELNAEIVKAGGIQNIGHLDEESFGHANIVSKDTDRFKVYGLPSN